MARVLGEMGVAKIFVQEAGGVGAMGWWPAFATLLFFYFYAHYFFASITARVSAMYVPFLLAMLAAGTPPYLAALSLGYFSVLAASLTHYGTTSAPIYFGAGYLTQRLWWRHGLTIATLNAIIWIAVGSVWWKLLGWW
jgi:DASS family divalent anion:Na+ symporter